MLARTLSPLLVVALASAGACGDGGGDDGAARTTTTAAARFAATASGTADIAGPTFSGSVPLAQDPANPSEVSPSESTIRVQLIDPATPPEARRTMSVGGAVRVGETMKTSSTLIASYIGDGVILTSTRGECSVTVDVLDGSTARGRLECLDVDAGGAPLTVKATFELKPTPPPPPATAVPATAPLP